MGLTQEEVAEQVCELGRTMGASLGIRHGGSLAADKQMVSKWERGEKRPAPAYRKLLCMLFGIPYRELWGAPRGIDREYSLENRAGPAGGRRPPVAAGNPAAVGRTPRAEIG